MSLINTQDNFAAQQSIPSVLNEPVPSKPSEQIHHKLLNLRDRLDCLSSGISEKLAPVMSDYPALLVPVQEANKVVCGSGLPPMFNQYYELIGHIELVVDDIKLKLEAVNI